MIGVFDSGVGGLSVVHHLQRQLPAEEILYIADQAHVPYGTRSIQEIQTFSKNICHTLLEEGATCLVVACNTASAAALHYLRDLFPHVPIVGMEPAVKPAAQQTKTGKIGVLATRTTFKSERYADLMFRFAQHITVLEDPCIGLVERIEAGDTNTPETKQLLRQVLSPMWQAYVDVVVLGCTHYPFVRPLIEQLALEMSERAIQIIDPAPAVARQVGHLLNVHHLATKTDHLGQLRLKTTGTADIVTIGHQLLGVLAG